MQKDLFLGIDVGTTKIAAVVADGEGRVEAVVSRAHAAVLSTPEGRAEQDAGTLLSETWAVVRELPLALRQRVQGIGVAGQMHGVVLLGIGNVPVTPLITWQDGRCLEDETFLDELYETTGHRLHTGYGLATLAWMQRHRHPLAEVATASTIQDLVVARLCDLPRPVTDPSDAASWGLFDLQTLAWDAAALDAAGLPSSILPVIQPFGWVAGSLDDPMAARLGLSEGLPVRVAIGDLQASLLATIRDHNHDIALTIGTGGQATVITADLIDAGALCPTCSYWPYPGDCTAIVAASLSGGAAWAWLVDSVVAWLDDLNVEAPSREAIFEKINALGLDAPSELVVHSHFLGERHDPSLQGSIHGINLSNFSIGGLAHGLGRSIVLNLRAMLPPDALTHRKRVVGSGNALRRMPLLQQMVEEVFGLPLTLVEGREEAATGAALIAAGRL